MASTKRVAPAAEERFLILLRHGIAEDPVEGKADEQRALTVEGHARMKLIARGLERAFPKANAIYSSPLLRAMQTAMWAAKGYRSRVGVTPSEALAPGATTEQFLALIESIEETRTIVVGHEPNLTTNLRTLLGLGESRSIALEKGGCYGVRVLADGSASLEWLLPPRILNKLGEGE
ncbi:MAG TPA: histidine phosphatase family protein [Thermoanaerobaculia bacterium]|nr:histidine phosphatase family protein [Thermoanaerobaculia bacterium]